jgi:hypothetical protein
MKLLGYLAATVGAVVILCVLAYAFGYVEELVRSWRRR